MSATSQRDEDALLYLAEMFPDRSVEYLQQVVVEAPDTANIQQLVEQILRDQGNKQQLSPQPVNNSENKDENEEKHRDTTIPAAWEMISLVPPNTTSTLQQEDHEPSAPPQPLS